MDNGELKPCALCGGGIAACGSGPGAGAKVTITIERLTINTNRLNAHLGLEQHFAAAGPTAARALADIMGPGSVVDEGPSETARVLICEACLGSHRLFAPLRALKSLPSQGRDLEG